MKANKDTGRYDIGQEIIVANIANNYFSEGKVERVYELDFPSYLDDKRRPVSVLFKKLKVVSHHKVPYLYDDDQIPNCDGYLLVDEDGKQWHNQYPYANYGQLDTSSDSLFFRTQEDAFKLDRFTPFVFGAYSVDHLLSCLELPGDRIRKDLETGNEGLIERIAKATYRVQNYKAILLSSFMKQFGETHEIKTVTINEGIDRGGKPYKITCEKVVKKGN